MLNRSGELQFSSEEEKGDRGRSGRESPAFPVWGQSFATPYEQGGVVWTGCGLVWNLGAVPMQNAMNPTCLFLPF